MTTDPSDYTDWNDAAAMDEIVAYEAEYHQRRRRMNAPGYGVQPKSPCPKCGRLNVWYVPECNKCGHDLFHGPGNNNHCTTTGG